MISSTLGCTPSFHTGNDCRVQRVGSTVYPQRLCSWARSVGPSRRFDSCCVAGLALFEGGQTSHRWAEVSSLFPLLVPESPTCDTFHGFVSVAGRDYHVRVGRAEDSCSGSRTALEVDEELLQLLRADLPSVQQQLEASPDLPSFLIELKDILERVSQARIAEDPPQAATVERIVAEIEDMGWDKVYGLSESFQTLQISVCDAAGRPHILEVEFPRSYPTDAPACRAALPLPFMPRWDPAASGLRDLAAQFRGALGDFQRVWDALDDFDAHTWVLEPERPTRDALLRRIAIGHHSSMQVDLDAQHPLGVPEVRFLGADSVITPLRDRLNQQLSMWDSSIFPRANLQRILQLEFPSRKAGVDAGAEEMSVECAICYTYRLDGALPDVVCDNPRCARPFHGSCLYEWLRSVPASRQAFNTLFGSCTYCSGPISLPNISHYQ